MIFKKGPHGCHRFFLNLPDAKILQVPCGKKFHFNNKFKEKKPIFTVLYSFKIFHEDLV